MTQAGSSHQGFPACGHGAHKMTNHAAKNCRLLYFAWFVLALALSAWLTLHMPPSQGMRKSINPPPSQTQLQTGAEKAPQASTVTTPQTSSVQQPSSETVSPLETLWRKAQSFTRLFLLVGMGAFLGGFIEARSWHMILANLMGRLTRMARLPDIVGLAMPTALVSNAAANSMLVASHADGHIPTSALIAGGMANSYLTYVSHSLRVMYPVVGAIGLPGFLYFGAQFTGGFLVIMGVLLWNRWRVGHSVTGAHTTPIASIQTPAPWLKSFEKALLRAARLLFRVICITVPLMIGIEWLLKDGAFAFWEQYVPSTVTRFFPVELVSVVAAQMGGLIQSSLVSANLRTEGLIDNAQILLAMLVGSAVGNPFRTLRRNLPSALAIFPPKVAFAIVISMQVSRLLVTIFVAGAVVAYMHYVLY